MKTTKDLIRSRPLKAKISISSELVAAEEELVMEQLEGEEKAPSTPPKAVPQQNLKPNPLFYIKGVSMTPWFRPGDQLLVDWNFRQTPQVGDLLILHPQGEKYLVAHRFLGENLTKGDRNFQIDQFESAVVGLVQGYERGQRRRFWRREGQPFKMMIAEISKLSCREDKKLLSRLRRCFFLALLFAIYQIQKTTGKAL